MQFLGIAQLMQSVSIGVVRGLTQWIPLGSCGARHVVPVLSTAPPGPVDFITVRHRSSVTTYSFATSTMPDRCRSFITSYSFATSTMVSENATAPP